MGVDPVSGFCYARNRACNADLLATALVLVANGPWVQTYTAYVIDTVHHAEKGACNYVVEFASLRNSMIAVSYLCCSRNLVFRAVFSDACTVLFVCSNQELLMRKPRALSRVSAKLQIKYAILYISSRSTKL